MTSHHKESILQRWSRQKLAATTKIAEEVPAAPTPVASASEHELESEPQSSTPELPDISELTAESDYSGFLSPEVTDELRNKALHKLFHSPEFNITDGMDDYDEDFSQFAHLGSIITADMRHQTEREAEQAVADSQNSHANKSKIVEEGETEKTVAAAELATGKGNQSGDDLQGLKQQSIAEEKMVNTTSAQPATDEKKNNGKEENA